MLRQPSGKLTLTCAGHACFIRMAFIPRVGDGLPDRIAWARRCCRGRGFTRVCFWFLSCRSRHPVLARQRTQLLPKDYKQTNSE